MARENGTGTTEHTTERLEEYAANRLSLDRSAVRSVHADEVELTRSAVAFATAWSRARGRRCFWTAIIRWRAMPCA